MADCVSVMDLTLVCDGKRRLRRSDKFLRRDVSCCLQLRNVRSVPSLLDSNKMSSEAHSTWNEQRKLQPKPLPRSRTTNRTPKDSGPLTTCGRGARPCSPTPK